MGTTLNTNILFALSGVIPGYYRFEQNPESLSIFAPKQKHTIFPLVRGENIYMRALLDNQIRVMKWSECSYNLYTTLKTYSARDANGDIPTSYFWDGTVKEFQGAAVQIIDVYGAPIKAKTNWSLEVQFKPLTNFDKEYKVQ